MKQLRRSEMFGVSSKAERVGAVSIGCQPEYCGERP